MNHMPIQILKSFYLSVTRMIDRESKFSKLRMSAPKAYDEEIDNISDDVHHFLEICSIDDVATGSGILEESYIDDSMHLGSIWISVAKLSVPVMEGEIKFNLQSTSCVFNRLLRYFFVICEYLDFFCSCQWDSCVGGCLQFDKRKRRPLPMCSETMQ